MLRRITLSAGTLLAVSKVYAAEPDNKEPAKEPTQEPAKSPDPPEKVSPLKVSNVAARGGLIPANQLPLYGEPAAAELVYIPETEEYMRQHMTTVRRYVWERMEKFEGAWNKTKDRYATAKQHTQDLFHYLREDAGALPRAGFITVAGLGGVVAGYKGGVIRKTVFASMGMVGAAAVCYPQQAVDISRRGWVLTRDQALDLWRQTTGKPETVKQVSVSEKVEEIIDKNIDDLKGDIKDANQAPPPPSSDKDKKQEPKDSIKVADKNETKQKEKPKEDFGMSKPEDKDMYSTRKS